MSKYKYIGEDNDFLDIAMDLATMGTVPHVRGHILEDKETNERIKVYGSDKDEVGREISKGNIKPV